jgi:ferredoxin
MKRNTALRLCSGPRACRAAVGLFTKPSNLGAEEVLIGEEEAMKVEVDQMKCGTVGFCVKECPEVFRFQEGSKKAAVIIGEIPPALQKKCRDAARKCPNAAITIEE